jgi:hypothetical protein
MHPSESERSAEADRGVEAAFSTFDREALFRFCGFMTMPKMGLTPAVLSARQRGLRGMVSG